MYFSSSSAEETNYELKFKEINSYSKYMRSEGKNFQERVTCKA